MALLRLRFSKGVWAQHTRMFSSADAAAFDRIVHARVSSRDFDASRPISDVLRNRLLHLAQSADQRARLARCMVGGINSARVAAAPLSVVFAADLQAASSSRDLQVLERGTGKGVRYLRSLETDLAAFSSFTGWTAEHIIKEAALRAGGSLGVQLPTVNVPEAWAFKNAAFAAQTLLLGATAHGLASCVMEGFNGDAVRSVCKVPPRYGIPLIVALGYAAPPPREPSDGAAAPSPRYALHEAARLDSFEEPLPPPAGTSAGSNGSE